MQTDAPRALGDSRKSWGTDRNVPDAGFLVRHDVRCSGLCEKVNRYEGKVSKLRLSGQ